MAKNRFNKRNSSDVSMIEVSENGVIKMIMVPLSSISPKSRKISPTHASQNKTRISVPIAPKKQVSNANALLQGNWPNNSKTSQSSNMLTIGQINQSLTTSSPEASTCSNFVGIPQTNCLPSSNSFIQPFQTYVINHSPVIINQIGGQSSGPLFSTSFQQQPVIITSKTINPNIGSGFVLQSNTNPIQSVIQIPNQPAQIQLISNNQTVIRSHVNSLSQQQLYVNQPAVQNTVFITPQTKPFVLNQTNQVCLTQQVKPDEFGNANSKASRHQPQEIMVNNKSPDLHDQFINASQKYLTDKSCNLKARNIKTSKMKKILPKTSMQMAAKKPEYKELNPDKLNLIHKLTLAAERTSNMPLIFTVNDNQPSVALNSIHLNRMPVTLTTEAAVVSRKTGIKEKCLRNICQIQAKQKPKNVKAVKSSCNLIKIQKVEKTKAIKTSKSENNMNLFMSKMDNKLSMRVDEVTKHALVNQVPTVVLNQISIPPGVMTTKVTNLKFNSAKVQKFKKISLFRTIQPKPPLSSISTIYSEGQKEILPCSSENHESRRTCDSKKQRSCSKSSNESESDYTIAQMLDTDDSWIDEDEYKDELDTESKKKKNGKLTDKSYKCYLGKAAESSKYPRTRSFFKAKH